MERLGIDLSLWEAKMLPELTSLLMKNEISWFFNKFHMHKYVFALALIATNLKDCKTHIIKAVYNTSIRF